MNSDLPEIVAGTVGVGRGGQHLTISLLLGALVLAVPLTDTLWAGTGRRCKSSCALAHSPFVFPSFLPFPPCWRISCAVTSQGVLMAGGAASRLGSVLVTHRTQVRMVRAIVNRQVLVTHLLSLQLKSPIQTCNPRQKLLHSAHSAWQPA